MATGGKKEEYDFIPPDDDLEWGCEWRMNIRDLRMVYSSIDYYSHISLGKINLKRPKFLRAWKSVLLQIIIINDF